MRKWIIDKEDNMDEVNEYVESLRDEIQERDKLLEQAKSKLLNLVHGRFSDDVTREIDQWLKDYEELKK